MLAASVPTSMHGPLGRGASGVANEPRIAERPGPANRGLLERSKYTEPSLLRPKSVKDRNVGLSRGKTFPFGQILPMTALDMNALLQSARRTGASADELQTVCESW